MKFFVIIAAICITSTLGLYLTREQSQSIFPRDSICLNKINSDDLENVLMTSVTVADPENSVKCYTTCTLMNLGIFNSQNNVERSMVLATAPNLGFNTSQAMGLYNRCSSKAQNIVDDGICVNGFELWKCLVSALRNIGLN